jgi:hypothetical protein
VIGRLVAAGAMVAAAVFLLLVARDAWHWSRAMRDGDARVSLGYVTGATWSADTTLPASLTRGLLGLDDDIAFRRAASEAFFQSARVPSPQQQKQRAVLESTLTRISRSDGDPARAAAAADDLGALLYFDPPTPSNAANPYQDPTAAPTSDEASPSEKAEAEFELAVRLDPSNSVAARNLEVLLRATSPTSKFRPPRVGSGDRYGAKGSGSRLPGHGY